MYLALVIQFCFSKIIAMSFLFLKPGTILSQILVSLAFWKEVLRQSFDM